MNFSRSTIYQNYHIEVSSAVTSGFRAEARFALFGNSGIHVHLNEDTVSINGSTMQNSISPLLYGLDGQETFGDYTFQWQHNDGTTTVNTISVQEPVAPTYNASHSVSNDLVVTISSPAFSDVMDPIYTVQLYNSGYISAVETTTPVNWNETEVPEFTFSAADLQSLQTGEAQLIIHETSAIWLDDVGIYEGTASIKTIKSFPITLN